MKRIISSDKCKWIKEEGEEAEEAASRDDMKTFWSIIKDLTGKKTYSNVHVTNKRNLLEFLSLHQNWVFFLIKTGVRQGCILPMLLLLTVIDFLMRRINWIDKNELADLDFADNIALAVESIDDLQAVRPKKVVLFPKSTGWKFFITYPPV